MFEAVQILKSEADKRIAADNNDRAREMAGKAADKHGNDMERNCIVPDKTTRGAEKSVIVTDKDGAVADK